MSKYEDMTVLLEPIQYPESYNLRALAGNREVGRLSAIIHPEREVFLSDLRVQDEVELPGKRAFVMRWLCRKQEAMSFRGRGIGSMILEHFLNWCRETEISVVYGSVVQNDLDVNPWLLDWYRRHGFQVSPPAGRCLANATHMIVWRRDFTHPTGGTTSYGSL